jgi:hypothetical protein
MIIFLKKMNKVFYDSTRAISVTSAAPRSCVSVRGACAQVPRLDTQQISNEYSALYHAKVLNAPLTSQPYIMQKFFSDLGT